MKFLYIFCVLCIFTMPQLSFAANRKKEAEEIEPEQPEEIVTEETVTEEIEPDEIEPDETESEEIESEEIEPEKKSGDDISKEVNFLHYKHVPRYKSILLSPTDPELNLRLGPHVRYDLALTDDRPEADSILLNLKIIEAKINLNYKNSLKLLKAVEKEFPDARTYFHVSKHGYKCNSKFCSKHGNGHYAFGVCSSYSCRCEENVATGLKCKRNLVYDPLFEECENPLMAKVCGF